MSVEADGCGGAVWIPGSAREAGLNPTWSRIIKPARDRHENRELSFVGKST